jgi:hypothetical protein
VCAVNSSLEVYPFHEKNYKYYVSQFEQITLCHIPHRSPTWFPALRGPLLVRSPNPNWTILKLIPQPTLPVPYQKIRGHIRYTTRACHRCNLRVTTMSTKIAPRAIASVSRPVALSPNFKNVRGHAAAVDPPAPGPGVSRSYYRDGDIRSNWRRSEIQKIYDGPLMETIFRAVRLALLESRLG